MKQKQSNYLALALFIVYAIITIIQISLDELLSAWLYFSIAFVTIDITLFEAIKNITLKLISYFESYIQMNMSFQDSFFRHINIYDKFPQLNDEKQELKHGLDILQNKINIQKVNVKIKRLRCLLKILDFIQILCCACIILLTPIKIIPYDTATNKLIAVLSLVSFSFTFFTIYLNSMDNYNSKSEKYLITSDYYLNLLEKIADEKENTHNG